MEKLTIKYYVEDDSLTIKQGYEGDAAVFDLPSGESLYINAGNTKLVSTKVHVEIPKGYFGMVADRSSMANNQLFISGGIIDSNYRGEIKIVVNNFSKINDYVIKQGDRIAQLIILPCITKVNADIIKVNNVKELEDSNRSDKGFGSSGK